MLENARTCTSSSRCFRPFDKPTIAAINDAAVAGGLTLALCCDFRIAASSAKLGDTSLRVVLIPDEGERTCFRSTWVWRRRCGCRCFPKSIPRSRQKSWDWSPRSCRRSVAGHRTAMGGSTRRRAADCAANHQTDDVQAANHEPGERALEDAAMAVMITNYTYLMRRREWLPFTRRRKPRFQGR